MSSHEPRELPQRLGTSHARAARTTEAENLLTRLLALGILERPRLIESSAVTVVAGVEPPRSTRASRVKRSRAMSSRVEGSSAIARVANRYGGKSLQMRWVERARRKKTALPT